MSQAMSRHETVGTMLQSWRRPTVYRAELRPSESARLNAPPLVLPLAFLRPVHFLVIGHELSTLAQQIRWPSPSPAHRIQVASTGRQGLEQVLGGHPDVVLLDMHLPDQFGLDVLEQIRSLNARIPVICVTRATRADVVIAAMRHGAFDCLFQPLRLFDLQRVLGEALDVARHVPPSSEMESAASEAESESVVLGFCPAIAEVYKAIGRVAAQSVPVLITGESGTGKELVARAIYQHGQRANAPFLALNCAAIPESLLESELFGHEIGAFTGADRRRLGKFEQCNGGTIFLDEIGDMPRALQAKILRLLQEQVFERVGGNETVRTDVRLIAATNQDLKSRSANGRFRQDLYYRLGVFSIHLPPLRERGEDLELLVQHYVRRFSRELGREVRQVAPEVLACLRAYSWPGNVRELQSVLKQALLKGSGSVLLPAFLPDFHEGPGILDERREECQADLLPTPRPSPLLDSPPITDDVRDLYADAHRQTDQLLLPRVLEYTRGNLQQAALLLGIARQTLRLKLRDLGLSLTRAIEREDGLPAKHEQK